MSCPILLVFSPGDKVASRLNQEATAPTTLLVTEGDHNSLWKSEKHNLNSTVRDWTFDR